ncbi:MAG TPA: hypothetical protein VFQ00_08185 [Terriglobales bacterium]|nr:hypothetical protein [Terriglobales bacterium]
MNEAKDKKEATPGSISSAPSSLPGIVMKPERRRAENATIRHWMNLGKKALDNPADGLNGHEEVSENSDDNFNPDA